MRTTVKVRTTDLGLVAPAIVVGLLVVACGGDDTATPSTTGLGVDAAELSPTVDNPFVAFAQVSSTVHEGDETDAETEERLQLRVESTVRDEPSTVAGVTVLVVEVKDFEDGELTELTEDYYAQHSSGDVYYLGERVDEYEDGEVTGHEGQWLAGEDGAQPGVFMPAAPTVGAEFKQENAPGVAEDRTTVVEAGLTVTVPAGTFTDCIKTEDVDPIGDVTEFKYYCASVGLVKEEYEGGSLELVTFR